MIDPIQYRDIIARYVEGKVTVDEFIDLYLKLFHSQPKEWTKESSDLVQSYFDGALSLEEFNMLFDKANPGLPDPKLFRILEVMYESIDAYSPLAESIGQRKGTFMITEKTLHEEASKALEKLNQYIHDHPDKG
jgi:hypothetical protein